MDWLSCFIARSNSLPGPNSSSVVESAPLLDPNSSSGLESTLVIGLIVLMVDPITPGGQGLLTEMPELVP